MKILVAVDMEGITGVACPEQTLNGPLKTPHHPTAAMPAQAMDLAVGDVNAVIAGLVDAGADDITVFDAHCSSFNLPLAHLHPAAKYRFGGAANHCRFPELTRGTAGVLLVGYHAMAGTLHAVLEHTMSSASWHCYRVNGRAVGELGIDGAIAGAFGVPVLMVSGDDKCCREARDFFGPEVVTVAVKEGLARHAAICLPPEKTQEMLRTGARQAVGKIGRIPPLDLGSPAEIELVFKHTHQADEADLRLFNGRRVDGYTCRWTCPSLADWWNCCSPLGSPIS